MYQPTVVVAIDRRSSYMYQPTVVVAIDRRSSYMYQPTVVSIDRRSSYMYQPTVVVAIDRRSSYRGVYLYHLMWSLQMAVAVVFYIAPLCALWAA